MRTGMLRSLPSTFPLFVLRNLSHTAFKQFVPLKHACGCKAGWTEGFPPIIDISSCGHCSEYEYDTSTAIQDIYYSQHTGIRAHAEFPISFSPGRIQADSYCVFGTVLTLTSIVIGMKGFAAGITSTSGSNPAIKRRRGFAPWGKGPFLFFSGGPSGTIVSACLSYYTVSYLVWGTGILCVYYLQYREWHISHPTLGIDNRVFTTARLTNPTFTLRPVCFQI